MLTKHAAGAGADASLQVSPYYNRPTQKGLYEHFKAVAESVNIPIILYNIASRTGVNIEPETIAKLAHDCKNIVGVKEASGSLDQMSRIANGKFYRATNRRELEKIYREIDRLEKTEVKLRRFTTYTPLFQWPLLAGLALLALELALANTRYRRVP